MLKGFVILVGVGVLFAYFVFNFVGNVEEDDETSVASQDKRKAEEYAKYYHKDAAGNRVLDFSNAPLSKAQAVWKESPIRQKIIEQVPQFEYMKEMINIYLAKSPFRDRLLKRLEKIEGKYLSGSIDTDEARRLLEDF